MDIPRERGEETKEILVLLYPVWGLAREEEGEESPNVKIIPIWQN